MSGLYIRGFNICFWAYKSPVIAMKKHIIANTVLFMMKNYGLKKMENGELLGVLVVFMKNLIFDTSTG